MVDRLPSHIPVCFNTFGCQRDRDRPGFLLTAIVTLTILIVWNLLLCTEAEPADRPLRFGTLQIEDVVPFYLAEQQGFFTQCGVTVELVPFLSALERDSALTAGAIDGAIDDPIGALLLDRGRHVVRITSLGLGKTPSQGVFAILAAPGSTARSVNDLKSVPIAVSSATIIDYVTERLLAEHGFSGNEIRTVDVKKMPIRMQMLLSDAVQAATLPEPLASIAAANGARILITDAESKQSISQTVVVFRQAVLDQRKADIAAFFRGYRLAVRAINSDPETYRDLFVRIGRIPPNLAATFPIPDYPEPQPFSRDLFEPVKTWLRQRELIPDVSYEDMVDTAFLGDTPP